MTEPLLWLDPERALRGAHDLAIAGRDITGQREGLGADIAAASAARPWGNDDIGAAFDKNYRGIEQALLTAWSSVGRYVEGLGAEATTSVLRSVDTDTHSGRRIYGAGSSGAS
jgi:hypothetical protein